MKGIQRTKCSPMIPTKSVSSVDTGALKSANGVHPGIICIWLPLTSASAGIASLFMSRMAVTGPAGCDGPELYDVCGDCVNWENLETPTEPWASERCLCFPFDDGCWKDEVDGDGDGAWRKFLVGFAPSGGKCSTSCTERAVGDRGGELGGDPGLGDFSVAIGVGIMG
jgi:hypothetical protein